MEATRSADEANDRSDKYSGRSVSPVKESNERQVSPSRESQSRKPSGKEVNAATARALASARGGGTGAGVASGR
jgi:hypothetical protein